MNLKAAMIIERLERQAANSSILEVSRVYDRDRLAGLCVFTVDCGLELGSINEGLSAVINSAGGTLRSLCHKGKEQVQGDVPREIKGCTDGFCQVTAEERHHLYGFLRKG